MPAAAWLAIGAAGAALGAAALSPVTIGLLGAALLTAATAARAARRAFARTLLAAAIGVMAVGLRLATGPAAPPPGEIPTGDGPWFGVVETVGSPREGSRPATVRLDTETPVLVAATLPWYPSVVPGDRIELRLLGMLLE